MQQSKRTRLMGAVLGVLLATQFAPTAGAKTVLTVMDWKINETKATQAWFQQVKERFEAENPGVEVEYVTAAWGNPYREKFLAGVAAGLPPDVVSLSIIWARDFYEQGALMSLNNYIKTTPTHSPDKFVPATQVYNQLGGHVYGITNAMDEAALLYNLDLFEAAGLDTAPYAIASWEDFTSAAKKLTRLDAGGRTIQYGYNGATGSEVFNSWLVANGGSFYADREFNVSGFNTKAGQETAQFLHDLINVHRVVGGSLAGRTAAIEKGLNATPYFLQQSAPDLRFNMTSFPQGPSGSQRGTTVWGNMMSIPAAAKNPDLAWKFIVMYTGLQGNIDMFRALNYVNSPRLDFYRSSTWLQVQNQHAWMPMVPQIATVGGVYPFRRSTELGPIFSQQIDQALRGQKPIPAALSEAERLYNQVLAQK